MNSLQRGLTGFIPALLVVSALIGATGFVALLASPETAMRAAISGTTVPVATAEPVQRNREAAANVRVFADEIIPGPHYDDRLAPTPATVEPQFAIGDHVTLTRNGDQPNAWEIVDVRRLGSMVNKISDDSGDGSWTLVVLRDLAHANAKKIRFLFQDGSSAPIMLKKPRAHSL